jgi:hypothetical protein
MSHVQAALVLVVVSVVLAAPGALAAPIVQVYVAPGGSDSSDGTALRPLASPEAARDWIRARKAQRPGLNEEMTVWLAPGTYVRRQTLELTAQDSGTRNAPISYRAAEHGTAHFLAGHVISTWEPVSDPAIMARLPAAARQQVRQSNLGPVRLPGLGELRSRGFGRPITPAHPELFYAGRPMTLARWPNEGEWQKIAGFPEGAGKGDDHGGKIGGLADGFFYTGDRPAAWRASPDIWVHGYWSWDWANSYERVERLDLSQHLVKTAAPFGHYGFRTGQRFYFLNVLEELDSPGEWYLDAGKGMLYFWPPDLSADPAARLSPPTALISVMKEPVITLNGASHIRVIGLTIEATRGHAVSIRDGTNNVIQDCALQLIGNYAVWLEGGQGSGVKGCDISATGDGGVYLDGGDRQTLTPGDHFVENCHFKKQGRWSKCYVPAVMISGVGQRVSQCLIHDHPHCAILFGGNEHTIEYNEIHHVALETGDVGAIYAGRDWTYRGNRIRYNYVHHTGGVGMGSMGVYMDDCVSGTEIYGNIFHEVNRAAFLGGGRDHRVQNNIFVDCDPAVQVDGRGLDQSPVWNGMIYDFMQKQLHIVPHMLYRSRYPALAALDPFYSSTNGVPPEGNRVVQNICVGGKWLEVGWHATPRMIDVQDNYVGPEPGFVSTTPIPFALKPSSPVWQLGFQPIPLEKIGLQRRSRGPVR